MRKAWRCRPPAAQTTSSSSVTLMGWSSHSVAMLGDTGSDVVEGGVAGSVEVPHADAALRGVDDRHAVVAAALHAEAGRAEARADLAVRVRVVAVGVAHDEFEHA